MPETRSKKGSLLSKRKTFSYQVSQPEDGLVDIEWIVHVSVDQSRGVDESDERELLGLGRRDLGVDVVNQPLKLGQGLEVRVQVESGIPSQGLPLSATETNTHFQSLMVKGHRKRDANTPAYLVTNENPWVSMATPVLWTCSSMYQLMKDDFPAE